MKEKKWLHNYFNKYTNIDYNNTEKNKLVSKHRHDMIVTYDSGRYFLIVPYEKKVKENKIKNKIVAIDPGVRTFHTFYSPDGTYGDLGDNLDIKLIKIHKKRDKLISKISIYNNDLKKIHESEIKLDELHKKRVEINNKTNDENLRADQIKKYLSRLKKIKCKLKVAVKGLKKSLKKKLLRRKKHITRILYRLDHKVENIVKDAHWKIASYYCNNYETIMIPQFDVNGIKKKLKKERKSKSDDRIRKLMSLKHGEFIEKLKYKCKVTGTRLWIVGEEYTTKSCGNCGLLNNPEVSKEYKCTKCKMEAGRDINAARNILIKNISMNILENEIK